jgi:signal transduction histidine kinase
MSSNGEGVGAVRSGHFLRWLPLLEGSWSLGNVSRRLRRLWRLLVGRRKRRPAPVPQWLRVGGLLVWGAVGGHTLLSSRDAVVVLLDHHKAQWLVGFLLFGFAYWRNTHEGGHRRLTALALVSLQSAIALGILLTTHSPVTSFLFIPIAGQLALAESRGVRGTFMVLQTAGIAMALEGEEPLKRVFLMAFYLAGQLFADGLCQDTLSGLRARRELLRAHNELRETRDLLAQSSRLTERLRISRELHDLLGHRLTALNLHLEVLSHLTEGRVLHHATHAQTLAKLLLGDVRATVSAMRAEPGLSLDASLSAMVEAIPRPRIHLDFPAGPGLEDPDRAHVLLRCVQEIVTNAVRHSGADNLWIEVVRAGNRVELRAWDDGRGAENCQPGNGLAGLSQRLVDLGGTIEFASDKEKGFRITVFLPVSWRTP